MIQVSVEPAFGDISEKSIVRWCGAFVVRAVHSEHAEPAKRASDGSISPIDNICRSPVANPTA